MEIPRSDTGATSEVPGFTRTAGLVAGAWGLLALVLQIIVAVNASRLPATVELLVPGFRGSHAHGILWSTGKLLVTAWVVLAVFFALIVVIVFAVSRRRWWLLIVLGVAAELLCLGAAINFVNLAAQFGSVGTVPPTDVTRVLVTVASLVGLFAPFITIFTAPGWISSRRRNPADAAV
jgi:hypothetical protein